MYNCDINICPYYTVLKKGRKYLGFCDMRSLFFTEMTEEEIEKYSKECEFIKKERNN